MKGESRRMVRFLHLTNIDWATILLPNLGHFSTRRSGIEHLIYVASIVTHNLNIPSAAAFWVSNSRMRKEEISHLIKPNHKFVLVLHIVLYLSNIPVCSVLLTLIEKLVHMQNKARASIAILTILHMKGSQSNILKGYSETLLLRNQAA